MRLLRHHPSLAYLTTVRGSAAAGTRVRFCRGAGWIGCWIVRRILGIRLLPMTAAWLVARSLARGIPAVVADAPHMRDGLQGDITSIPTLWTYPAHDTVAAAAALSAASTAPTVKGAHYYLCVPTSLRRYRRRETLDALRLHASDA